MKLPLKILLFLIPFASFSTASALTGKAVTEQELDQALKFYRDLRQLDVDFTQKKQIKSMNLTLDSSGHLTLEREKKTVTWEIKKPSPVKVILTPESVTMDGQVFKKKDAASTQGTQSISALMAWLSLDAHQLSSEYTILKMGNETYSFKPKNPKSMPFQSVEMKLDHQQLKHMKISEVSGDELEIHFAQPKVVRSAPGTSK